MWAVQIRAVRWQAEIAPLRYALRPMCPWQRARDRNKNRTRKAALARANLSEAGSSEFAELREGEAPRNLTRHISAVLPTQIR